MTTRRNVPNPTFIKSVLVVLTVLLFLGASPAQTGNSTTIHSFDPNIDGAQPSGRLIFDKAGAPPPALPARIVMMAMTVAPSTNYGRLFGRKPFSTPLATTPTTATAALTTEWPWARTETSTAATYSTSFS